MSLILKNEKALTRCLEVLKETTYRLVGDPLLIKGGSASNRAVSFLYEISLASEEIEKIVRNLPGIISVYRVHSGHQIKLTVNYDCNVIKGR